MKMKTNECNSCLKVKNQLTSFTALNTYVFLAVKLKIVQR